MPLEHLRPAINGSDPQPADLLLINVPATYRQGVIPDDDETSFGLLRVAVAAEGAGNAVSYLDAHRAKLSPGEIKDVIAEVKPEAVGINPTSVNVPEAQQIAEISATLGIPVILGGVHATLSPHEALKTSFPMAAAAVRGRGEVPIQRFLDDLRFSREGEHQGLYYQESPADRTDMGEQIPLDLIPPIDQARWVENPLTSHVVTLAGEDVMLNELSLFESAGCPFECTFCSTPVLVGRGLGNIPYQRHSMERILEDVRRGVEMGANAIHFLDDMALVTPQHFREFANGVATLPTPNGFYWRGMTRANMIERLTDEDLRMIVDSGCWRLAIGVESGNEEMLKTIKKKITKDQVRQAVMRLRAAGMEQIKAFFIMGFPGETAEQMVDTQDFIFELQSLGLTDISLFQFKPYPGSEEWNRLERTAPQVLKELAYNRETGEGESGLVSKKTAEGIWLPDHLRIAKVESGVVKHMILDTLTGFYG